MWESEYELEFDSPVLPEYSYQGGNAIEVFENPTLFLLLPFIFLLRFFWCILILIVAYHVSFVEEEWQLVVVVRFESCFCTECREPIESWNVWKVATLVDTLNGIVNFCFL
jgi:hypothetical protein